MLPGMFVSYHEIEDARVFLILVHNEKTESRREFLLVSRYSFRYSLFYILVNVFVLSIFGYVDVSTLTYRQITFQW